jgi:hypothetical protein
MMMNILTSIFSASCCFLFIYSSLSIFLLHLLLLPSLSHYTLIVIILQVQICVDTFLFSGQYTDVATLSVLSKYTGGTTYYYPAYHVQRDGPKFHKELVYNLTRPTGFEAVMRVRATRGTISSSVGTMRIMSGTHTYTLSSSSSSSSSSFSIIIIPTQVSELVTSMEITTYVDKIYLLCLIVTVIVPLPSISFMMNRI